MSERQMSITTGQDLMSVFVAHPDQGGPFPAVVMLMDGGGIREGLRRNARELAAEGYFVLLPDLFHRSSGTGPTEDLFDMDRMTELNTGLNREDVVADVVACIGHAARDPNARNTDRVGLIGYCMGGRLSVTVAQALGHQIAAVASFHPGYMATKSPTSPHLFLNNIKARVYFGVAETDPHLSPGQVERLKQALDENRVDYRLEVIAGAEHGFAVPGRESYFASGAEHVLAEALALFSDQLRP